MVTFMYVMLISIAILSVGLFGSLFYILWLDFLAMFNDTMKDLNDDFTINK